MKLQAAMRKWSPLPSNWQEISFLASLIKALGSACGKESHTEATPYYILNPKSNEGGREAYPRPKKNNNTQV